MPPNPDSSLHHAAVQRDKLIRAAVAYAGDAITEGGSFLESLLEEALIDGVKQAELGARCKQTGRNTGPIPSWDRDLGDFDIKMWLPGETNPSVLIEAKVGEVGETLWDLFKLTSIPEIKGAVAGYLLVAERSSKWEMGGDCVRLFEARNEPKQWRTAQFFIEWSQAWADLTGPHGGSARPTSCPSFVETTFIAAAPVAAFRGYEIRCVRVDPVGSERIRFVDGVPQLDTEDPS